MFIIKPITPADWEHALFILSYYHVLITVRSNGEDANTTYIVVEDDVRYDTEETGDIGNLRLAETAFQINWHQHGRGLCPDCIDHADKFDSCGHLTFTKPINSAF